MVNNVEKLKKLMDFSDDEKFYYLQLLRRSKDGGDKSVKVIKNFFISNEEYFDRKVPIIKDMCDYFGARAYLRMNRRSYRDVAFENLETMTKLIRYGQFEAVMSSFSKACGRTHAEKNKIWIVDVDEPLSGLSMTETLQRIEFEINELHKEVRKKDYKFLDIIPTVNGFHMLTHPFNVKKFGIVFGDETPDLHKDNPTILYANV